MTVITGGYLERLNTLNDGSVKITLATQEITQDTAGMLFSMRGKYIKMALSDENIIPEVIEHLKYAEIKEEGKNGKSKSQKLRDVFFRIWEKLPVRPETPKEYYDQMMDQVIDFYISKIPNQ